MLSHLKKNETSPLKVTKCQQAVRYTRKKITEKNSYTRRMALRAGRMFFIVFSPNDSKSKCVCWILEQFWRVNIFLIWYPSLSLKKGQMRSFGNFPLLRSWVRIRSEFFYPREKKNEFCWMKKENCDACGQNKLSGKGVWCQAGGKRQRSDARILAWPWHVLRVF